MRHLQNLMIAFVFTFVHVAWAQDANSSRGIVIHVINFGTSKFHRYTNKVHPYPANHAFRAAILPDHVQSPANENELMIRSFATPQIEKGKNGEYRFFYYTLEQMVRGLVEAVKLTGKPIYRLHFNGHGLPGGNLMPGDYNQLISQQCAWYKNDIMGPDQGVYDTYYGHSDNSSFDEVFKAVVDYSNDNRKYSMTGQPAYIGECSVGMPFWTAISQKHNLPALFADQARINFYTCHQAMGKLGEDFMLRFTELVFPTRARNGRVKRGEVRATDSYGGNDWSVPEGMVGSDWYNDQTSYKRMKAWWEARKDRLSIMDFTLVTGRQTGKGVVLQKQKTKLMRVE